MEFCGTPLEALGETAKTAVTTTRSSNVSAHFFRHVVVVHPDVVHGTDFTLGVHCPEGDVGVLTTLSKEARGARTRWLDSGGDQLE